ncbi:MAG: FAD-dependent oxidoreductase [Acidobacteria bacterium]|nr:FAD-dependent oxidoreductase [Acidobacteriota bacterium]MBI3663301.1 FAD-dependent oxidoreductase [Acidobacteriota bacterium]
MASRSVIIIGGGLAGLSSAVALAEVGYRVRLFESRPHLGGRATSYWLSDGSHVDNCQHVTLGCCTNLDDFYRRVGASEKIRWYSRLFFVDRRGRRGVIESSLLPPPLHLGPSFALFPSLTWEDKRAISRAMLAITRSGGCPADAAGLSMLEWLKKHGQTEGAITRFWQVVLVSALNEDLERTDARYGIEVFWKGFLSTRRGFEVGIPSVPLAELYDGCRDAITRRGGEVRTRAAIREIRVAGDVASSLRLDDGSELAADFFISAIPQDALLEMLPPEVATREPAFSNLRHLKTSPITGVHFWYDRVVMNEPFLTLLDRTTQWIFNKSRLFSEHAPGGPSGEDGQYLQLVISASYGLVPLSRQEIINLCRRELLDVLPATRDARLVKATVIKEAHATFSPEPGCDRWRPTQRTPLKNFFLAGDWTATGWPATMEGAVRSGYLAAEALLAADARPQKLVLPDLPAEGLARCFSRV